MGKYIEREIFVNVFMYEDDEIDLIGNVLNEMDCSFMVPVELVQRTYSIRTDSNKQDHEIVDLFIRSLKAAGKSIHKYKIIEILKQLDLA